MFNFYFHRISSAFKLGLRFFVSEQWIEFLAMNKSNHRSVYRRSKAKRPTGTVKYAEYGNNEPNAMGTVYCNSSHDESERSMAIFVCLLFIGEAWDGQRRRIFSASFAMDCVAAHVVGKEFHFVQAMPYSQRRRKNS